MSQEYLYPKIITDWRHDTMSFTDSWHYEMMINYVAYYYYKKSPNAFKKPYSVVLCDYDIHGDINNNICLGLTTCQNATIQLATVPFYDGITVPFIAGTFAHELAHWLLSLMVSDDSSFWENAVHFAFNDVNNEFGLTYEVILTNFLGCPEVNITFVDLNKCIEMKDTIETLILTGQAPKGKNPYWPISGMIR